MPSLEILDDDSTISVYAKDSLGVGNPNMILNFTVIAVPLFIAILVAMLLMICVAKVKMPQLITKVFRLIHSKIMWNSVLRYLIQTYLTFSITTLLALRSLSNSSLANKIVCIMSLIYLIVLPFFTFIFLWHNQSRTRFCHGKWKG